MVVVMLVVVVLVMVAAVVVVLVERAKRERLYKGVESAGCGSRIQFLRRSLRRHDSTVRRRREDREAREDLASKILHGCL